jgi:hypothetical protein
MSDIQVVVFDHGGVHINDLTERLPHDPEEGR